MSSFGSAIRRILSRKPKLPPINEDWGSGDFAQAIPSCWMGIDGPRGGANYLVISVHTGTIVRDGRPAWGLKLAGLPLPAGKAWNAAGFRKVYPDAFEEPRVAHRRISRERERAS